MSDSTFLARHGWMETPEGWVNRKAAPFAPPMPLTDAVMVQRFLHVLESNPIQPFQSTINRVMVECAECGKRIAVNADWCNDHGWPECCKRTMTTEKTMDDDKYPQWRVLDTYTGIDEEFKTETEALACAEKVLADHREDAVYDGEWPPETELLGVYRLAHSARVTDTGITDASTLAEYGMRIAVKELERVARKACKWTQDDDGVWHTACGNAFEFMHDGPEENGARWCLYCGGRIVADRTARNSDA